MGKHKTHRPDWLCWNVIRQAPFARHSDLKFRLEQFIEESPSVKFVHIGVNNGGDLLYQHWTDANMEGVLVEPQKSVFQRLQKNFGQHENLHFENAAIMDFSGVKTLYKASDESRGWETTLASFDRDLLEKQMNQNWFKKKKEEKSGERQASHTIHEEEVTCLTLEDIVSTRGWRNLDLLFIDAEGADGNIVLSISFDKIKVRFIYFESMHISLPELYRVSRHLKKHGFSLYCSGEDTVAIHETGSE